MVNRNLKRGKKQKPILTPWEKEKWSGAPNSEQPIRRNLAAKHTKQTPICGAESTCGQVWMQIGKGLKK